jgi:HSP20 family protein
MLPMLKSKNFFPAFVDEFIGRDFFPGFSESKTGFSVPAVNVIETKDEFKIEVAAPGLNKEDFKVDVDNSVLKISSEKETKNEDKNEKYMRCEFQYSSFQRFFSLPDSIAADKIKASHNNGILTVNIPKKDEAIEKQVRQIKIS